MERQGAEPAGEWLCLVGHPAHATCPPLLPVILRCVCSAPAGAAEEAGDSLVVA